MKNIDTLINVRWLLPIVPEPAQDNVIIAIDKGVIVDIMPADSAHDYQDDFNINLPSHVLLPGFVNTHNHVSHQASCKPLQSPTGPFIFQEDHI